MDEGGASQFVRRRRSSHDTMNRHTLVKSRPSQISSLEMLMVLNDWCLWGRPLLYVASFLYPLFDEHIHPEFGFVRGIDPYLQLYMFYTEVDSISTVR